MTLGGHDDEHDSWDDVITGTDILEHAVR